MLSISDILPEFMGINYPVSKISQTIGQSTDTYYLYVLNKLVNFDNICPRAWSYQQKNFRQKIVGFVGRIEHRAWSYQQKYPEKL
jgi:hypothetical protein